MAYSFYRRDATQSRKHLNNRIPWANAAPSRAGNRERDGVYATESHPNLAVFAAHPAISLPLLATILPFLPPITRNVKLPLPVTGLECGIREEDTPDTK
jgi:hypothetical protein